MASDIERQESFLSELRDFEERHRCAANFRLELVLNQS
jgi:hypothetical protein